MTKYVYLDKALSMTTHFAYFIVIVIVIGGCSDMFVQRIPLDRKYVCLKYGNFALYDC